MKMALRTALSSNRYIHGSQDGSALVVGLPVHGGASAAIVAYSLRPELAQQLGLVQNQFLKAALLAVGVGGIAGLIIATLIAVRLGRIARAAKAIGEGDFTVQARDRFPDEVGSLGASIDGMRLQLLSLVQALHDDRHRLERLLDRLDEGVLLIDRTLHVEFSNGRAAELLGISATAPATATSRTCPRATRSPGSCRTSSRSSSRIRSASRSATRSCSSPAFRRARATSTRSSCRRRVAARAERARPTRVRDERRSRAANTAVVDRQRGRDAADRREGGPRHARSLPRDHRERVRALTRLTRALLVLARAEADEEALACRRCCCARYSSRWPMASRRTRT